MNIECDRCKKIFSDARDVKGYEYEEDYYFFMRSTIDFYGLTHFGENGSSIHLCPECTYKLRKWVKKNEE